MILIAQVAAPEEVVIAVTARMKVSEWREVTEALGTESYSGRWHAAKFCELLGDALRQVEQKALKIAENEQGA